MVLKKSQLLLLISDPDFDFFLRQETFFAVFPYIFHVYLRKTKCQIYS